MKDLKDYLREEIDMLTQLRAECLRNISDRDPGSLFVSHYQGNTYYYSKKYKNTHRTTHYLGTETDERVGEHILNRVNIEKAKRTQSNIRLLNELLGKLCDYSNEAILDSLGSFYQTRTWNMSIAQARELELSIDGRNMVWTVTRSA